LQIQPIHWTISTQWHDVSCGKQGIKWICQQQHLQNIIQAKVEDENNEEKIVENEERPKKILKIK
jgi:hypothetical protein